MTFDSDILCIHYYYPPIRSGGVLRNYYMSRAFAQMFKTVHVITTSNVDVMDNEELPLPSNVKIYKASTKDFRSVVSNGNHISMKNKSNFMYSFLSKLKKTLPFHFYLDEGGQKYIRSSVSLGGKLIGENNISHIYSSFMPYADHLIASKLKGKNQEISWYADFRDLQVEPEYKNVYFENWNKRQERKIIKSATKVSTVSEGLARHLSKLHSQVISLPRGVEMREEKREEKRAESKKFTIVYTGSLFYDYRDGKSVVDEITAFIEGRNISPDTFQFVYAGREGEIWERWFRSNGIEDYLDNKGFIARGGALEIQNEANLLLLLTSSSIEHQGVFTGKLFEYLETGTPIINYINGIQDKEFESLFEETDAGRIYYPESLSGFRVDLGEYYGMWERGEMETVSEKGIEVRREMSWEGRAMKLLQEQKKLI